MKWGYRQKENVRWIESIDNKYNSPDPGLLGRQAEHVIRVISISTST